MGRNSRIRTKIQIFYLNKQQKQTKMANSKKSEALVVAVPGVTDAIDRINAEIKQIKHVTESSYSTSGKITTVNGTIDVKTETKVPELVTAYATVVTRVAAIEAAYDELGISEYQVVKIDGGTRDEWKKDIKLRIQVIQYKDRLDELNSFKKEWEELMDKEDRKAALAKKMQSKGLM